MTNNKRDENITFIEKTHEYIVNGNKNYISVTTLVKRLFEKFDSDTIIDNMMKSPNWKNSKYYGLTKNYIKNKWKCDGIEAANKGTKLHSCIEKYYNNKEVNSDVIEYTYFLNFLNDNIELKPYKSEWKVYNETKKISGTIDMVYLNPDGSVSIYDWKRSKEITKTSKYNKFSICDEINYIPDTNYWQYSIQLNLYKYILETEYNLSVKELYIVQLHEDLNNYVKYKVPILENEINNIL
jgi:hypothetical protein